MVASAPVAILISCVAAKGPSSAPAGELYRSVWFRKAREFARRAGGSWFVLSALHGLVHPDTVIAPYDRTLGRMSAAERAAWSRRVLAQIAEQIPNDEPIALLAGAMYRAGIEAELRAQPGRRGEVFAPLARLGIGEQLHWLGDASGKAWGAKLRQLELFDLG